MSIIMNPIFWAGISLISIGMGIKLGAWAERKDMARVGKTRKEYWREQFTVANNVLRVVMPYTTEDLLKTYSGSYADHMTEKLYGKEKVNG